MLFGNREEMLHEEEKKVTVLKVSRQVASQHMHSNKPWKVAQGFIFIFYREYVMLNPPGSLLSF